jgi:hypothetical protein
MLLSPVKVGYGTSLRPGISCRSTKIGVDTHLLAREVHFCRSWLAEAKVIDRTYRQDIKVPTYQPGL